MASTVDVLSFLESVNSGSRGEHRYAMLLGFQDSDWPRLVAKIERGFPYKALQRFQRNVAIASDVLSRWIQIAPRTLARRKSQGRLLPDESDRLLRAARVFGCALELFHGDCDGAVQWLLSKPRALGGATPLDVARTELGAREVERLIGRIEYGVYT